MIKGGKRESTAVIPVCEPDFKTHHGYDLRLSCVPTCSACVQILILLLSSTTLCTFACLSLFIKKENWKPGLVKKKERLTLVSVVNADKTRDSKRGHDRAKKLTTQSL